MGLNPETMPILANKQAPTRIMKIGAGAARIEMTEEEYQRFRKSKFEAQMYAKKFAAEYADHIAKKILISLGHGG